MRIITTVVLALALAGCPTTPVQTPKQGVAACYYTVRAAFDTAADMRARGKLSDASRIRVLSVGDKALASCDAARLAVASGDLTKAENQLKAAELILLQLEAALKESK